MLAHRALLVRPALGYPAQVRTISLARIALEPARKTAPPPPPPPPAKKPAATKTSATAKTVVTKTTTKATPKATTTTIKKTVAPATRTRSSLTPEQKAAKKATAAATKEKERERIRAEREKKKEQALKAKEKEKERAAKEREKLREQKARAKEREEERRVKAKERERLKEERREALQKPYPPPPKRPMPGYFMFSRDPTVKRQKGEGVTEDAMFASEAWKSLTDAEREVYNKKSEKARAQWKEDVAKWVSSLNLAQLTAARLNREPGTHDGATFDTLPKRPGNAFALFVADVYRRPDLLSKLETQALKESGGDDTKARKMKIGLVGRTAGDMWRSMPEREKGVYMAKAADAKKEWEKNFGHLVSAQKEAIAAAHP